MIHEQGESLQRIDDNVAATVHPAHPCCMAGRHLRLTLPAWQELHVEAAHGELVKYLSNVSSNRWLMLKIFGVLIFFFIVFVVFLA